MSDAYDKSDKTNMVIDIKRSFLSGCRIPDNDAISVRRIHSEPELESNGSYDNIRGSWRFDNVPLRSQRICTSSTLYTSKLITPQDINYMRKQQTKKLLLLFLEKKIDNASHKDKKPEIFLKLLWQIFKTFKEKLFTNEQISTIVELIVSAHNFYLTDYWNTPERTYKYFLERVLLCSVTDPPKCAEIFSPNEVTDVLEFFHDTYLENIILLHLVYMNHYRIVTCFGDGQR